MNSTRLLAAVLVLFALCGAGFFFFFDAGPPQAPSAAIPGQDASREHVTDDAPLGPQGLSSREAELEASQRTAEERESLASADSALVIEISVPPGAPADAQLEWVAVEASVLGEKNPGAFLDGLRSGGSSATHLRGAVGSDYRARIELPATMESPVLLLDGRFLFTREATPVPKARGVLRIDAKLGACLVVKLRAPDEGALAGRLGLYGANFDRGMEFEARERAAVTAESFEFRALDADSLWTVAPTLESHAAYAMSGIELEAGEELQVELELLHGATVSGRVVDDRGQGFGDIEVRIADNSEWSGGSDARSTRTDADGGFELRAVPPGQQIFEAVAEGWVSARTEMVELADGEALDGLKLVVHQGLSISGVVQCADGGSGAGAKVVVSAQRRGQQWGGWGGPSLSVVGEAEAGSDGSFAVTGLEEGAYQVSASLPISGRDGERVWRGLSEAVSAGTRGLSLVLEAPVTFAGKVENDLGEPMSAFEVLVESTRDEGPSETQAFEAADGRFQFTRAGPGEWELTAKAPDHVQLDPVRLVLPATAGSELVLVLERRGRISGVVVDSTGAPAPGARVRATDGRGQANPWAGPQGPLEETDAQGRFQFAELSPGTFTLVAQADDWADSEELVLDVLPGESSEGALLTLRVGGRIEGTLATDVGDPVSGKRVVWGKNAMGFGSRDESRTDPSGSFLFEHVTPGTWSVSAAPSFAELGERMQGRRDQSAFIDAMGDLVSETVTVIDGEVVEVYLGGEPKRPVRVFGTVTQAGAPLKGATAFAVSEDSAVFQGMKSAEIAEDGSYEMILDRPGGYVLSARAGSIGVEFPFDIPRQDEVRVDMVIPLGTVAGRVRVAGGGGAGGIQLSLQREDGLGRVRWGGDSAISDEEGEYAFVALEPGSYTVRANTASWTGDSDHSFGTHVRAGVKVDQDQATHGIDFTLLRSGKIEGIVRDPDGEPLGGVSIFFRGAEGMLVTPVSGTITGGRGEFSRDGLAPGNYTMSARAAGFASGDDATVRVNEGETAKVELGVEVGTLIEIVLEEGDEEVRRARFEVFDEEGLEIGGMLTLESLQALFNEGAASFQKKIGPFPAGRYLVRATTVDGRTVERKVRLRGRGDLKRVKLKLDAKQ